jgi:NADPH2:quinone reductase
MKAVVIPRFGAADVLEVREMPVPQPGPGEVAIDVAYAGVNYAEVLYRRGIADVPLPFIPGIEVSGSIRALGEGVRGLRVGQPVAALTIVKSGGYAEVAVTAADLTFPLDSLPGSVDLATAAAFPSNTTTAYVILSEMARLMQGETILIHAAAGGVGSALGQVARSLGAENVIGTVSSVDKIDYAKSLGYDHVFLRRDFVEQVQKVTEGKGIDIVVDPVGSPTRIKSLELLRPFGRLIVMGNASNAEDVAVSTNHLWLTNKAVQGFNLAAYSAAFPEKTNRAGRAALELVACGKVSVAVTGVLPLEQASEAQRRIEQGVTVGKLVLRVGAQT